MRKPSPSIIKMILLCAAFAMASVPTATAQQELSIQSEAMQDTREFTVHLPKNYDPDREEGYPVFYMLDAGSTDKMTAELASFYNWGYEMPELIVIGLKNAHRGPDFLPHYYEAEIEGEQVPGNGAKLLAYIETELMPFANRKYNTGGKTVFVGHSWAGQYVAYALSQKPDLFDAYLMTSPAFGNDRKWSPKTFAALEQTLRQSQDLPDFIYLSVGGGDNELTLHPDYFHLTALFKQHLPDGVKFYHELHKHASHTSSSAISLAEAMQLLFPVSPPED